MAKMYFDQDVSLASLRRKTIGVIGYGNQGQAQALNIRDSGFEVIVGNRRDGYARSAEGDGFSVSTIRQAVLKADILIIALPDEIQEQVYEKHIGPNLRPGQVLDFASSYTIHFECIVPPEDVDVVMMSPRAMGVTVRESFVAGKSVPGFVAVAQDASGRAQKIALALAKAVGCTRVGVMECTFANEAHVNLLGEQALWPLFHQALLLAFEVAVEGGVPPEVALIEFCASGEASEVFRQMALEGIFKQARYHSPTSRYGTLSRAKKLPNREMKETMREILKSIKNGEFAAEWALEQGRGYPNLTKLARKAAEHPITKAEKRVQKLSASPRNFSTSS